jgi:hypothetical protein
MARDGVQGPGYCITGDIQNPEAFHIERQARNVEMVGLPCASCGDSNNDVYAAVGVCRLTASADSSEPAMQISVGDAAGRASARSDHELTAGLSAAAVTHAHAA